MISVACDICGQEYEFAESLYGKLQKCRECETRFEVSDENAPVEPDTEGAEPAENGFAAVWRILRGTAAGIAILIACGWMTALLFYDPWNRPPLEFQARNQVNRARATGTTATYAPQPAMAAPAAGPAPTVPQAPQPSSQPALQPAPEASSTLSILAEQRAAIERHKEEMRIQRDNALKNLPGPSKAAPPPAAPTPAPGMAPAIPPSAAPPGRIGPRFGPRAANPPGPPGRP